MAKKKGRLSFTDAAYEVLKDQGRSITLSEITDLAISQGLIKTESKRPKATMGARLRNDKRFIRAGEGKWTLRT